MKLLDLFCGAGGAAMGYHRAGFDEIVGVDIKPQPRYPFTFVQAEAVGYCFEHGYKFDAIHASPPCQKFSRAQRIMKNDHPDFINAVRLAMKSSGAPYVIENVYGSPLDNPILLCGLMFGLKTFRHRMFETSFESMIKWHPPHHTSCIPMGRKPNEGDYIHVVGNIIGVDYARKAMGIDWMTGKELAQAIPPAYTQFIGEYLIKAARESAR